MKERYFSKIHFELAAREELFAAAKDGIFVSVAKHVGQLERHYYQHLFRSLRLPAIGQHIDRGESILLSLPASTLEDDLLFLFGPSNPLLALFELPDEIKRRIFLVPLEFIWDKRPSQEARTTIDLLFGDKEDPGFLRKLILFFRNYRHRIVVKVGKPIPFRIFEQIGDRRAAAAELRTQLLSVMHIARRATTGPKLRPRSWVISRVLSDEILEKKLMEIAAERGKHFADIMELAAAHIKEIAADIDYTAVDLYDKIFQWIYRSLYKPPRIHEAEIERLKELVATKPVVFVPNHKSHLDSLLLSSLLNQHYVTIPHIAAGKNLAFWPLGKMLRRGGAYFIRRAFRENRVYREVLQTYLRVLLESGYAQEFFIEGGRSRTGKLLPPRLGMLRMLLQAASEANIKELTFVPVSITYDHVIEQKSYADEQSGKVKKVESQRDIVKLTRFFARRGGEHGNVYIRFGDPMAAPTERAPTPDEVQSLANAIGHEINRHLTITPSAIVAAGLVTTTERGIFADALWEKIELYFRYLCSKEVPLSESLSQAPRRALHDAVRELEARRLIRSHPEAFRHFYEIPEDRRLMLDYIKNGAIHALVSMAFLCRCIASLGGKAFHRDDLLPPFQAYRHLFVNEFRFSTRLPLGEHADHLLAFLESEKGLLRSGEQFQEASDGSKTIRYFHQLIVNFIESYRIAGSFLQNNEVKQRDRRDLLLDLLRHADHLLLLGKIASPEARSRWALENALDAFRDLGILHETRVAGRVRRSILTSQNLDILTNLQALLEDIP